MKLTVIDSNKEAILSGYKASKNFSVYFVLRGNFWIDVAMSKRRIASGKMFFVRPNLIHQCSFGAPGGSVFHFAFSTKIWKSLSDRDFDFSILSPSPLLRELALGLNDKISVKTQAVLERGFLLVLFDTLKSQCEPNSRMFKPLEHRLREGLDKRVYKAISTALMGDESGKMTANKLAKHAHISERQLNRLLFKSLGMTIVELIRQSRVERAIHALMETDDSVTDIAFKAGFSSLSQFNATFRTMTGETPSKFRSK